MQELPESPELVVLTIRPEGFETAVDDALRMGARAIVAITSGLGERDAAGREVQVRAADRCRREGAILVGPNCLGVADLTTELDLTWDHFMPGALALVSQSGNIGLELSQLGHDAGVGFSRFVSLGNQADLSAAETVEDLIGHAPTRVIALYIEDFVDGLELARMAQAAGAAGKPLILLTIGSTSASRRMAYSHTGALVSDSMAVDAACRASGMYRVDTPQQMIDLAQLLLMPSLPLGRRLSIIGDGGGHVALAADRLAAHGLQVDRFSDGVAEKLAEVLPPTATTRNPVDVAGGGEEDVWSFERAVRFMAESGEADVVLLTGYFGGYSQKGGAWADEETEVAKAMAQVTTAAGRPLIVQTMYPHSPTSLKFREQGVPVYGDIEAAARALGATLNHHHPTGLPSAVVAESASPLAAEGRMGASAYFAVRTLLITAGIPFAEGRPVASADEALAAAAAIGYPVVLKALAATHKSDVGAVRLAIANDAALHAAFGDMQSRLHPVLFSVERQAPIELGVELLIGVKRDRSFGPIALVGLGGLYAEVFRDVAVALAPVTAEQAATLIRSLRGGELLLGWRGRPRLNLEAAADALRILSELAASAPHIAEIEINPLLVLADAVVGLDARLAQSSEP